MALPDDQDAQQHSRLKPSAWRRWLTLTTAEKKLSAEAFALVALVRALVYVAPDSVTSKTIKGLMETTPSGRADPTTLKTAHLVADAIKRASLRVHRANCLVQAISGWFMLWRRGIESSIHVGVQKDERQFMAHAWLTAFDEIIVGGSDSHERFVTLGPSRAADRQV